MEHARAVDAAWIGTIHGFCARVLRSQPLAAGLDPRFAVLDEAAAAAARRGARSTRRWRPGPRRRRRPGVDLAAAYGRDLESRWSPAPTPRCAAAARAHPRLPVPPAAAAARSRRRSPRPPRRPPPALATRRGRRPRAARRAPRCEAAERIATAGGGAAAARRARRGEAAGSGAKALEHAACAAYREAWAAYREACADVPRAARRSPCSTRCSTRFGDRVRGGQVGARGGRLRRPRAARPRPARRPAAARPLGRALRADHGRRVPGHEPAAARRARGAGARQPVRGRRRGAVDLRLPPRRRADLPRRGAPRCDASRVRSLTVNFRSRHEILAVVNAAFGPLLGSGFTPLVPGRAPEELRLFEPDPPGPPRGRAARRRDAPAGTSARPSSGSPRSPRSRGAAPRPARSPPGCARRSTPAARSATSSCSCARRARCGSTSRRSRSRG